MPNRKPDESLDIPMRSRSLGIALGATELIFIAGLILLATGASLTFGWQTALTIVGAVLVVTSWLMQFAD